MTDELPEKLPLTSMDVAAEKRDELRRILAETFPEAVAEEKIDLDQLKRVLGEWVEPDRERFGLNWPGKAACMKVIQAPSVGTLKPCPADSVDWGSTQNIFIEGDNLEVLKLLQKAYFGKIKLIYIDPPYNTGKEFIYPDKYSETLDTYLRFSGQSDDDGKRFSTNAETDGRFHSKWMNMMYPRLFLAKNLLTRDGVIFISIDNNELSNLKLMCDEIFGGENFLGIIARATGQTTGQDGGGLGSSFDFALGYSRDGSVDLSGLPLTPHDLKRFENEDAKGKYAFDQMRKTGSNDRRIDRPNMYYGVLAPDGAEVFPIGPTGYESCWRFERATYERLLKEDIIIWKKTTRNSEEVWWPYVKYYLEDRTKRPSPLWNDLDGNKKATRDLRDMFDGNKMFDFPKPVAFVERLIQIAPNSSEDDIVLDFFAGSGTTGHAVYSINATFNSKRKFILVQLPEPCGDDTDASRAGYRDIAQLSRERIRRAGRLVRKGATLGLGDNGFRAFKLDRSSFKRWSAEASGQELGDLVDRLEEHADHIDPHATKNDILFELLLKDAFPLDTPVEILKVAGKEVFSVADGALLICLEVALTEDLIDALAELEPARVICLDAGFQGNDQLKANAVQTFKARARSRETAIEFRTV